jgi:hypothetical protein
MERIGLQPVLLREFLKHPLQIRDRGGICLRWLPLDDGGGNFDDEVDACQTGAADTMPGASQICTTFMAR